MTESKILEDGYDYMWAKFSILAQIGHERYAKGDCFHYPLFEWVTRDFKSAINQIVDKLKCSSIDNPIMVGETITIHNIAYCAHFKIHSITNSGNIIEVKADHMIEDDKITLYFIQKK